MSNTPNKLEDAKAVVRNACSNLIVEALVNDLAAAKVQIDELTEQLKSCSCDKPQKEAS